MKASKFTDAQKALILKQAEEGLPARCAEGRHQRRHVLFLAEEVRRLAADRDATAEAARGRERTA